MIDTLAMYWQFPFVKYALIVGVLTALCSSLLGVALVLKRFSFIGDGLSHAAFGAMAVAGVLNLSHNTLVVLMATVLCAVWLLRAGQNASIKGDAAVAMLSAGALAAGYLVMNVFPSSANISGDVCTTLFGSVSILTLSAEDVWLSVILAVGVVIVFVMFYNRIFALTFDEDFARAAGVNASLCSLVVSVVIGVVIVLAMKLAGSLLISALVVFPAMAAMRVFRSFGAVTVCAAGVSVVCAVLGIGVSILAGTPVGSTIVLADLAAFGIFYVLGVVLK